MCILGRQKVGMYRRFRVEELQSYLAQNDVRTTDICPVEWLSDLKGSDQTSDQTIRQISRSLDYLCGHRQTYPGRYLELDEIVAKLAADQFPSNVPIRVHDVAASNAITSIELYYVLKATQPVNFWASDLNSELIIVNVENSEWSFAFFPDGHWCQARSKDYIMNASERLKRHSRFDRETQENVTKNIARLALEAFNEGKIAKRVSLFHPRAMQLEQNSSDFHLESADITSLQPDQFDIVRAMIWALPKWNEQLRTRALRSLCGSVRDNGLLVIGHGEKCASIFVRSGKRMMHLAHHRMETPLRREIESLAIR
jgi:hypothetical protein